MSSRLIAIQEVNGRLCVSTGAFGYCNTKYHKPYLAVVDDLGRFTWQPREYVGYGKNRVCYYVVENLKAGDVIQAAGGSGSNKYPHKGTIVSVDLDGMTLEFEKLSDKEFGNIVKRYQRQSADEKEELVRRTIDSLESELADFRALLQRLEGKYET